MQNLLSIITQVLTVVATVVIAYYGYQSYKLSEEIKQASERQQKNINKFTMALITAALFIARAAHTSKTDVKIQDFDSKLKEVEKYFEGNLK